MTQTLFSSSLFVSPRPSDGAANSSNVRRHGLRALLRTWMERGRQRQALAELDDRLLRDIGVTRAQAEREIAKPSWCS
ncbi:MAG: DUF1127 domain-containing protein [Hyphomicrobiaceae bacterium]